MLSAPGVFAGIVRFNASVWLASILQQPDRSKPNVPTTISFSGLPGVGKTTIARELARQIGAVHLSIDTIEQAIRSSIGGDGC